jgi:hypothetical protein
MELSNFETRRHGYRSGIVTALFMLFACSLFAAAGSSAEEGSWEKFDHFRTRFPLVSAHERVACGECHRGGIFEGTPRRCALCHDGTGMRAQTSKDIGHIRSTNDCDDCHLMGGWVPSRVDHGAVQGSCFLCHNGVTAEGKHAGHVPTSTNDCELCHSTARWTGARFDHFGIDAPCITCHNNVNYPGKPGDHIASSNQCEECHNTRDWEDADFNHDNITSSCTTCHSGDLPSKHFVTTDDCSECHSTDDWSRDRFRHTASSDYPGDHAGNLDCTECHPNNSVFVEWSDKQFKPDCAGCHASEFWRKQDKHKNKQTGDLYTASELRDCSSSCHVEDDGRPEHSVGKNEW